MVQNRSSKTVLIKVDPELFTRIKKEAKKLDIDVPSYVKWCIQTGIYLDDLNTFVRSQGEEPE